jgi:hypothetical protein
MYKMIYTGEHIYIHSDIQAALQALKHQGNIEACLGMPTDIMWRV